LNNVTRRKIPIGLSYTSVEACKYLYVDPRAAELAGGYKQQKKCGLTAGKIAVSRQPGR